MYIEPCCIDRQLPRLLRSGARFFQTSGDITVQKFLGAVSCLAGRDLTVTLVMPDIDTSLLRVLAHYFAQGWMRHLRLLTRAPRENTVHAVITTLSAGQRLTCISDPLIVDGMLVVQGTGNTVIVQGAMLPTSPDFGFSLYSCYLGNDLDTIAQATEAVEAKFRIRTPRCGTPTSNV